jgi:hypothetical protein
MSHEPEDPLPLELPTRDLLLAQALETCIKAERQVPGSADLIVAHQPAWARTELRRLVALAGSLDAVATNAAMAEEFRVAARARLMERIGGESEGAQGVRSGSGGGWIATLPSRHGDRTARRRRSRWLWRGGAGGLVAVVLILAATLTASANALPGEPLYGVKQAGEEIGLRFAPDDHSRALALLRQADTRLDETARLLQQGRTDQVAQTTHRFDDVIDRATTTFVVTIGDARAEGPTTNMETKLTQQHQQLQNLLLTAPEPARADLRDALVTTERNRALVADSQRGDLTLGRTSGTGQSTVAAAPPATAMEADPTPVPTLAETTAQPVEARDAPKNPTTVLALNIEPSAGDIDTAAAQRAVAASQGARGGSPPKRAGQAIDDASGKPAVAAHTVDNSADLEPADHAETVAVGPPSAVDRVQPIDKHVKTVDDAPQPAVVEHQAAGGESAASESRGNGEGKPTPLLVVTQPARTAAVTDHTTARDSGDDGRAAPATVRPQVAVMPTLAPDRRATSDMATKTDGGSKGETATKADSAAKSSDSGTKTGDSGSKSVGSDSNGHGH